MFWLLICFYLFVCCCYFVVVVCIFRLKLSPRALEPRQYYSNDHENLCSVNKQDLDPRQYFKTTDKFFPERYTRTSCSSSIGSKRGYPVCLYGVMDCITIRQDISFMRMPSVDCSTWYHDVIPNVPVGCACMLPRWSVNQSDRW